jgi:anaerobic magnesium-protoporphyrin IX monomethyl ester cyclase
MLIALAYPHTKRSGYQCTPPLALLSLATVLKRQGFEIFVFDRDGFAGGSEEMVAAVADLGPDLVGLPLYTGVEEMREFGRIAAELRRRLPRARIIAGGPHVTACPEQTLARFPEVDLVLRAEADETFPELVEQLAANRAHPDVPGLCRRHNGGFLCRDIGDPPEKLDDIPIADRSLLAENYRRGVYWRIGRRGSADLVMTSRGCPFNCKFCFKVSHHYRARSPEHVLTELEALASFGVTSIDLEDDLFTASKARCVAICRGIRAAGLRLDLKVRSRANTIDRELIAELKATGVRTVVFGIESGSQAILDSMNKKVTVEDNRRAIALVKKSGLQCIADLILGFPGESVETAEETKRFLLATRPTAIQLGILCPFPKTRVYDEAKEAGRLVGDWDEPGTWPYVDLPGFDRESLVRTLHDIQRAFYRDPRVVFNLLRHNARHMKGREWRAAWRYMAARVKRKAS